STGFCRFFCVTVSTKVSALLIRWAALDTHRSRVMFTRQALLKSQSSPTIQMPWSRRSMRFHFFRHVSSIMIIKNKTIIEDDWQVLRLQGQETAKEVVIPDGKIIVPLKVWLEQRAVLQQRNDIGVWLASDERPEDLTEDIH